MENPTMEGLSGMHAPSIEPWLTQSSGTFSGTFFRCTVHCVYAFSCQIQNGDFFIHTNKLFCIV